MNTNVMRLVTITTKRRYFREVAVYNVILTIEFGVNSKMDTELEQTLEVTKLHI